MVFLMISKIFKSSAEKTKDKHRVQHGKITYNDLSKPAKPLFSKKYMIAGKPDYIIKNGNHYIPVEFKTGKYSTPLQNHVLQLAAYCQLIEENYNDFVSFGILVYNQDSEFKIPFNPKARYDLESTIKKMRYSMRTGNISLNHDNAHRCKNCSMKKHCDKKII
jgi:CRISPR-associated exonuclease Cas4